MKPQRDIGHNTNTIQAETKSTLKTQKDIG